MALEFGWNSSKLGMNIAPTIEQAFLPRRLLVSRFRDLMVEYHTIALVRAIVQFRHRYIPGKIFICYSLPRLSLSAQMHK